MKRYILYLTFAFIGIQFTGCKKYAEGPAFTLLSKKQRAANTWEIDTYFENGVNKTSDALTVYKNFVLILDKNNMKYSKSFMALGLLSYGESGSWKFSADLNNLEFTPDNTSIAAYSWKILKLKEKSLGLSYTTNNVEAKLYLK
jgi:hypothetical protein